jgi:hypothetical protein
MSVLSHRVEGGQHTRRAVRPAHQPPEPLGATISGDRFHDCTDALYPPPYRAEHRRRGLRDSLRSPRRWQGLSAVIARRPPILLDDLYQRTATRFGLMAEQSGCLVMILRNRDPAQNAQAKVGLPPTRAIGCDRYFRAAQSILR